MLKAVDQLAKGKKILAASGIYAIIKVVLATVGVELAEYEVLFMELATAVDAVFAAAIVLFRMAQEDIRGI